ncbi:unnamed protein product [Urochloa decumbens]|uniref:Uncharacterized protein n=1 Tax=Urochloa decumbens TaxID=240449 RepID=A0ABC9GJF6_9POAL
MLKAEERLTTAIKMDKTTIILCSLIGSLGVLGAILGFSAEGTKLTPYTILVYGDDCIYPPNPALGLGVCAAIFLLVSQVTFSAAGGCCGCCTSRSIPSETKRFAGIVCAVFSWIAAVIAWALLIEGASWNASVVRETAPFCPYLKDGIFAGAGVLTLAATALGVASIIMLRRQPAAPVAAPPAVVGTPISKPGEQSLPIAGVAMDRPPLAPQPQPSKPQEQPSEAQVLAHTAAHSHKYGEAPQNPQSPPGPGSNAPNQELPAQGRPADAAAAPPAAASTTLEPGRADELPVHVPSSAPQQQQQGYKKVIGREVARAGVRLIARVVGNCLL